MGKNNKKRFKSPLQKEKLILEERKAEIISRCMHDDDDGSLAIDPIGNGLMKCELCEVEFSLDRCSQKQIEDAITTLNNMVSHMKLFSNSKKDADAKDALVSAAKFLMIFPYQYNKVMDALTFGKKKNKNKRDHYGSVGASNLNFIR